METVTPVNEHNVKEMEQVQEKAVTEAIQVQFLVSKLIKELVLKLERWRKSSENQGLNQSNQTNNQSVNEQSQDTSDLDSLNVEVTINGQKKPDLTWEDYGKIQALSNTSVGDTIPDLANIKVELVTSKQRQTLLETDAQGKVVNNAFTSPQPQKTLSGFDAINRALAKLPDTDTKAYLSDVSQQMQQQFAYQQQLLKESLEINQSLSQQLQASQSTLSESQKINLEYAKLFQEYQQKQQYRDVKEPKGWQNLLKNPIQSVQNWWEDKQQKYNNQREMASYAVNLRNFAQQLMGNENELQGDKYDISRQGNLYELKDKQGMVLLSFKDLGVLGCQVNQNHLTNEQKEDLKTLAKASNTLQFLSTNSLFVSQTAMKNQFSSASNKVNNAPTQAIVYNPYATLISDLRKVIQATGSDINKTNVNGYDITTQNAGSIIEIKRSSTKDLLLEQKGGKLTLGLKITTDDQMTLKKIVDKALNAINQRLSTEQKQSTKSAIKTR